MDQAGNELTVSTGKVSSLAKLGIENSLVVLEMGSFSWFWRWVVTVGFGGGGYS